LFSVSQQQAIKLCKEVMNYRRYRKINVKEADWSNEILMGKNKPMGPMH